MGIEEQIELFKDIRDYLIDTSALADECRPMDILRRLNEWKYNTDGFESL